MRKLVRIALCALLLSGCMSNKNDNGENDMLAAVDLSAVIEAFEKNGRSAEVDYESEVFAFLDPHEDNDTSTCIDIEMYDDEPFTEEIAEYRDSDHPMLKYAEDIYNSCLIVNAIWSNFEVWDRFYEIDDTTVAESIKRVSVECLRNKELLEAASKYRDGMADLLSRAEEAMEEDVAPMDLRGEFTDKIEEKWYHYYTDADSFMTVLEEKYDALGQQVDVAYKNYLKSNEDAQLGEMLKSLTECSSFDEQCVLFSKWANSKESEDENEWIVAVAKCLMESKHYSPFLYKVWLIWRPLCQFSFYGLSRDSDIPNRLYNRYRAMCYVTTLQYLARHEDDIFAMNSASILAGRGFITRFGQFSLGNQSSLEMFELLPNRYREILDNDEDEDEDEEDINEKEETDEQYDDRSSDDSLTAELPF